MICQYLEDRCPEPAVYPADVAFVDRVLAAPPFLRLEPFEDRCMRTPPAGHRAALAELGAPLTADTIATTSPRRGFFGS